MNKLGRVRGGVRSGAFPDACSKGLYGVSRCGRRVVEVPVDGRGGVSYLAIWIYGSDGEDQQAAEERRSELLDLWPGRGQRDSRRSGRWWRRG